MNEHLLKAAEESQEAEPATLQSMTAYAEALDVNTAELKALEVLVKEKKQQVNKLAQELLPSAMNELGMHSMELNNGTKISVKEDISCSVVDIEKLYSWLEERGDDAIVKTSIETEKLPRNILNSIVKMIEDKFKIEATGGLKIHAQTLNAYFRKVTGTGGKTECEIPVGKLDEKMIKVFAFYKTVVKR